MGGKDALIRWGGWGGMGGVGWVGRVGWDGWEGCLDMRVLKI